MTTCNDQLARGHRRMDILRKLKRAIARDIFKLLTRQVAVPDYAVDLRPARQAKNITVSAAANHFRIWPPSSHVSNADYNATKPLPRPTERGSKPLDTNRSIKFGAVVGRLAEQPAARPLLQCTRGTPRCAKLRLPGRRTSFCPGKLVCASREGRRR